MYDVMLWSDGFCGGVGCDSLRNLPCCIFFWLRAAWDYSAWVRTYALFLEERLECFRVLKYDVESERPTVSLLGFGT